MDDWYFGLYRSETTKHFASKIIEMKKFKDFQEKLCHLKSILKSFFFNFFFFCYSFGPNSYMCVWVCILLTVPFHLKPTSPQKYNIMHNSINIKFRGLFKKNDLLKVLQINAQDLTHKKVIIYWFVRFYFIGLSHWLKTLCLA